jgi:nucleotide-binding universal stress UspA family protein
MFARILVPTDGSELSQKAARGAIELARQVNARIIGVTVVEPYSYTTLSEYRPEPAAEYERRAEALARERLEPLETGAKAANVEIETTVAHSFSPYEAIIETARRRQCDAIFMASHGRRGLSAILLGSETQKVLTHTDIPVMVYR